jgi:hypothetical protein
MALFFRNEDRTMMPVRNDATTTRDEGMRRSSASAEDDDPRPEPRTETDDPAPEEAGYGYGV